MLSRCSGHALLMSWMCAWLTFGLLVGAATAADKPREPAPEPSKDLLQELTHYPHKIVYETNRDGNWELYLVNADGSNPVNLTNTKDVDELYPKPSPDGTMLSFVADEKKGKEKVRNVYVMNIDGTATTKLADNA